MNTTMKVLRDAKLNDCTLIRLSIDSATNNCEISAISKDGERTFIRLPYSTEAFFELMQMAYKLLHGNLQKDLGKIVLENSEKDSTFAS